MATCCSNSLKSDIPIVAFLLFLMTVGVYGNLRAVSAAELLHQSNCVQSAARQWITWQAKPIFGADLYRFKTECSEMEKRRNDDGLMSDQLSALQ